MAWRSEAMALLQRLFDAIVDGKAALAKSLVEEELKAGTPIRRRSFPTR